MRALAIVTIVVLARDANANSITLRDAIGRALLHNNEGARATANASAAAADERAHHGLFATVVEAEVSGDMLRDDPAVMTATRSETIAGELAIIRPFERGARARVSLGTSASRRRLAYPTQVSVERSAQLAYEPRVEVEWSEPLLGGTHAGSAEGARLAHLSKAARFERADVAEQIARETSIAYWQLYLAQREVEIRASNEAVAREQLRLIEAEIARGARPKLAAAEVEDELARRRDEFLVARRVLTERSLDLAFVIGEQANEDLRAGDAPISSSAIGLEAALELARVHSPRLGAAAEMIEAATAQLERVDDEQRSRVDVALRGAAWASDRELAEATRRAAGTGGWSIDLAIRWRLPLSGEARHSATTAARARATAARLAKSDVERELADAVVRAVRRQENAAQRRVALERAIELAMTTLDAERKRWERGDTTTYEVLRRQSALADVQIRAERARVDEVLARSELEALTGRGGHPRDRIVRYVRRSGSSPRQA